MPLFSIPAGGRPLIDGSPAGCRLIVSSHLKPDEDENFTSDVERANADDGEELSGLGIIKNVTAILICMAVETMISGWIGTLICMSFPSFHSQTAAVLSPGAVMSGQKV